MPVDTKTKQNVVVVAARNPSDFYLRPISSLTQMEKIKFLLKNSKFNEVTDFKVGKSVIVKRKDNFLRAEIAVASRNDFIIVSLVDYGELFKVSLNQIYNIPDIEILLIPKQAIHSSLLHVSPISTSGCWPQSSCSIFHKMVNRRIFSAKFESSTNNGTHFCTLTENMSSRNERSDDLSFKLVQAKLAVFR